MRRSTSALLASLVLVPVWIVQWWGTGNWNWWLGSLVLAVIVGILLRERPVKRHYAVVITILVMVAPAVAAIADRQWDLSVLALIIGGLTGIGILYRTSH